MGKTKKMNKAQKAIYDFIAAYIKENGSSPTVREICEIMCYKSTATVVYHLTKMEEMGVIKRDHNGKSRSIHLIDTPSSEKRSISVNPVKNDIASCCICHARNYDPIASPNDGNKVDNIMEIDFGNANGATIVRVCPDCLADLLMEGKKALSALPKNEVYIIVAGYPYHSAITVRKGVAKTKSNGDIEVTVKDSAAMNSVYVFTKEHAKGNVFDNEKDAQAAVERRLSGKPLS